MKKAPLPNSHIICVASTKGGVGKSTIAANIAVEATLLGRTVMLVDADIQGSCVAFRAIRTKDDIHATSILTPTLHRDISRFKMAYDVIIIDVGGRDSAVLRSAIIASDLIVVPILPSQYDIWATADTVEALKEASAYKNLNAWFLFNQYVHKSTLPKEAEVALKDITGEGLIGLLCSSLGLRVAFKKSISLGLGVSEYESKGIAAAETQLLYEELWRCMQKNPR